MKIAYLHQYFNTPNMAGGTRSYEMGRRLVDYGHEVHMITSYRQESFKQHESWFETNEMGINVNWLPVPYSNKLSYRERIKAFIKFAWKAAIKTATINCDVVFATSTPLTIVLPAVYASKKLKVPMVFEVRDLWPELPIAIGALRNPVLKKAAKCLEYFAYRNSDRIIALSPGMKDGIVLTGYSTDKVKVIPNSCDIDLFKIEPDTAKSLRFKNEWLKDRPLILYAGTIGLINGVDYLAGIAKAVWTIDKEIRFLIIGEGNGEKKLKEEAEALSVLGKNLFIMPKIPKAELVNFFAAADMTVSLFINLKEMWANSANKFFDSLAAGKPVIINYEGWQAEIVRESGAGLVVDPLDADKAGADISKRVRDKEWLKKAGSAAYKLAVERFNRDDLAKEFENVLIEAVNSK